MSLPSSDRFNIVDYSYRAQDNGEGELFTPSVFNSSLVPYAGLEINGDGLQFHVDHTLSKAQTEKAAFFLKDSLQYEAVGGSESYGIPEDFSVEFDILLTESIPRDFNNVENRLFVGALNAQGHSSGILFSHQGMALAAYPEDPEPTIIGGSRSVLVDNQSGGAFYEDGTNVRVVINGAEGRITVYATPSKDAYEAGSPETNAPVFYTGRAKNTGNLNEDSVVIWASGETISKQLSEKGPDKVYDQDVTFFIRSLRVASYKAIPEDSPIAITKSSPYLTLGERVVLKGIDSYDPGAKAVTYNWEVEVAPKESRATLEGSHRSVCNLQTVSDYDGSLIDVVQLSFIRPTQRSNTFVTNVYKAAVNKPLSLTFDHDEGVLSIFLEVDADGEIVTTASDIVDAFMSRLSAAFDPKISGGSNESEDMVYPQLFRADLIQLANAGTEKITEGTFLFSGGSGSTLPNPGFIADKQGIYVFSLQVDNGKRKSRKSRLTCTASNVTQLLGHRPNSKYIFKYLPDFWKLVNDTDQLETIWSSVTQVISNEMLQTWQNDYAKSLKDVARQYQRRWLSIPTLVELGANTQTTLVTNQVLIKDIEIPHVKSGFKAKFSDSSDIWNEGEVLSPGLKLVKSSVSQPYVVDITSVEALYSTESVDIETTVEHHCEGIPGMVTADMVNTATTKVPTGYYRMVAASPEFIKYRVISERSAGYFSIDPEDPDAVSPIVSSVMRDITYPMFNIDPDEDLLRIQADREVLFGKIIEFQLGGSPHSVRLEDLNGDLIAQEANGTPVYWDHLTEPSHTKVYNTPYITLSDDVDVEGLDLLMGDTIRLSFIDPYSNKAVSKEVPILVTHKNSIFLEWACIVDYLNDVATAANDTKVFTEDDINLLSFNADRIYRTKFLEPVTDLVSAPTLGFNSIVPEFNESVDYSVISGGVVIEDLFSGVLTTEAGSDVINFNPGYVRHNELLEAGFDNTKLFGAGVHCLQIHTGVDAGFYRIQEIDEDTGAIRLNRPLTTTSNKCKFISPRFSLYGRPGERLWAELSYFDNWQTIENNFGLFVGLPKELVDSYDPDLDYLSVIKSMWFAFLSGPSFDNVQLAVQSLFGLPFSEVDGRVIYNEEPTPTKEGLILVTDGDGRIYTYHYPYGSSLAINPNTGRQIKAYDDVASEELLNLSEDQRLRYKDSRVSAYTRLVDAIKVEDYISDMELVENAMSGSDYTYHGDDNETHVVDLPPSLLQKYHTFVVDVPLQVARKTSVFPLISDFLQEAKPAYTNFILRGSILFSDEVNVVEEMFLHPTILLKDTPHTSPFFATKLGEDSFGQPAVLPDQEVKIWPVAKTYEKFDMDFSPILEASHFCLSGPYADGVKILTLIPELGARLYIDNVVLGTNLGRFYQDTQTYEWHPVMEEVMKVFDEDPLAPPFGGVAIAVPGTPDFEIFAITEAEHYFKSTDDPNVWLVTKSHFQLGEPNAPANPKLPPGSLAPYESLNCLFFTPDNFPPPMPIQVHWDDEDVKEKYESGYCEGVVDDYSGDGSWNMRRAQLDMVNTANSDIDVLRSRQWVRITHYWQPPTEGQNFFQVGETISMADVNGESVSADIWDSAPPVVLHVGYGENPKLTHVEHPAIKTGIGRHTTYLVLGFEVPREGVNSVEESDAYDYEAVGINNYGHESRLDVIKWAHDTYGQNNFYLVGNTSGAMAKCSEEVDRDYRSYKETIWQVDKLIENGPASDPTMTLTTYFPVDDAGANAYPSGTGGLTISKFRARSESFDPDHDDTSAMYQWEYQQIPPSVYPPPNPDNRMLPSFSPGFYTGWDLDGVGDITTEKVVWGYDHDGGSLLTTAININDFKRPGNYATAYLQNVHMGMTLAARKEFHVTQGFTNFRIPAPSIKMILPSSAGYDLRICGFYFCNDDPSRVNIPTSSPSSFGNPANGEGVIGGSWVFFRNSETLEEIGNVDWSFETGTNIGEPILPKGTLNNGVSSFLYGSNEQPSDGHIIECHIPNLVDEGYYDVIIRNYRPYLEPGESWGDPSTWVYNMDETVAYRAYYHDPEGHGGISWGTDPFGTGGNN